MAKGPYDDIVRKVLERLGANAPKAATTTTKSVGRKAASVPAKPLTKAERSAANRARAAADRAKIDAKLAAERPAKKAARTAEAKAKGVARANRKAEEAYGYGANQLKTDKAKAFFEREVDKAQRIIDATNRMGVKGSQGRRDMLTKQINKMKEYATKEGYELKLGDVRAIVKDALSDSAKANAFAKKRLAGIVNETKGKTGREVVEMGARRARAQELKTGKVLTGSKPARITPKMSETQKRLSLLEEKRKFDAVIKKADSKMGAARGPQPKKPKKVVEQESSKRLRSQQEKNAKKNIIDPKVAKMSPTEYKKFIAKENAEWKAIKNRKINQRGLSDKDAKDILADLGKSEFVSDKRKLGPYPTTDRYGRYSGKRK
jgi:hypothetical protein